MEYLGLNRMPLSGGEEPTEPVRTRFMGALGLGSTHRNLGQEAQEKSGVGDGILREWSGKELKSRFCDLEEEMGVREQEL